MARRALASRTSAPPCARHQAKACGTSRRITSRRITSRRITSRRLTSRRLTSRRPTMALPPAQLAGRWQLSLVLTMVRSISHRTTPTVRTPRWRRRLCRRRLCRRGARRWRRPHGVQGPGCMVQGYRGARRWRRPRGCAFVRTRSATASPEDARLARRLCAVRSAAASVWSSIGRMWRSSSAYTHPARTLHPCTMYPGPCTRKGASRRACASVHIRTGPSHPGLAPHAL